MTATSDLGVGVIGAGSIVNVAHMPAYTNAGIRITSVFDANHDSAQALADKWGLTVCSSAEELFARSDVDIVDMAVTPDAQQDLAAQALQSGKHVMAQKPFAHSLAEAQRLVDVASECDRLIAVNQQMRWGPTIQSMKSALESGLVGDPVMLHYHMNIHAEYPVEHWLSHEARYMASYGAIHPLDGARFLLGEPERVTSRLLKDPEQNAVGETFVNTWVEWADGTIFVLFDRYTNRASEDKPVVTMRLEGTKGAVRSKIGIYENYPQGVPDFVEGKTYGEPWAVLSDQDYWLPAAFSGPMLGLMAAVRDGGEPPTSAKNNLGTLRIVEAMYMSNELGRTVNLSEVG
jgi:predicted dehydrogenase